MPTASEKELASTDSKNYQWRRYFLIFSSKKVRVPIKYLSNRRGRPLVVRRFYGKHPYYIDNLFSYGRALAAIHFDSAFVISYLYSTGESLILTLL